MGVPVLGPLGGLHLPDPPFPLLHDEVCWASSGFLKMWLTCALWTYHVDTSSSITFSFHFIGDQQKLQQLAVAKNGTENNKDQYFSKVNNVQLLYKEKYSCKTPRICPQPRTPVVPWLHLQPTYLLIYSCPSIASFTAKVWSL